MSFDGEKRALSRAENPNFIFMPKAIDKTLLALFFGLGTKPDLKNQLGKNSSVEIGRTDDKGNFIPKPRFDTITKPNA